MAQSLALSAMPDTVRVRRKSGSQTVNETTGELEFTYSTIYEGPSKLVLRSGVVRDVDAQSQLLAVQSPRLDLPVNVPTGAVGSSAAVTADDEWEIVATTNDVAMVGRTGKVSGRFDQSWKSARRLPVEVWS